MTFIRSQQKIKYFKTSAKTGENIVEAFESLIKDLLGREKPKKKADFVVLVRCHTDTIKNKSGENK